MNPQTAEQINQPLVGKAFSTAGGGELKIDPKKIPLPVPGKNPVRFSINGIVEKIPELKKIIAAEEFDEDLRAYILSELDELKSNAAEIHLHDVEFGDGQGFDLHLSIRARHLGTRVNAVFRRGAAPSASPPGS